MNLSAGPKNTPFLPKFSIPTQPRDIFHAQLGNHNKLQALRLREAHKVAGSRSFLYSKLSFHSTNSLIASSHAKKLRGSPSKWRKLRHGWLASIEGVCLPPALAKKSIPSQSQPQFQARCLQKMSSPRRVCHSCSSQGSNNGDPDQWPPS